MAQRVIQLLRSSSVYESKQAAMDAIAGSGSTQGMQGQDGEVRIARYFSDGEVKDLLCVYHDTTDSTAGKTNDPGWTFIEDASDIADILSRLDGNINAKNDSSAADDNKVVTAVLEVDGVVTGAASNITGVKLAGYSEGTDADVAATDTLGEALGKLQAQINAMDLTETGGSGKIVTTISEADGKVSATAVNTAAAVMTGYTPTTGGSIAATDTIGEAFNKVEEAILKNKVSSDDKTVVVTPDANGDTDLAVNIDNTTIVKNSSTGVLKADLKLTQLTSEEVTALSDNNVKEAYKLIYHTDANRTAIGNVIKIYKDSSLVQVYLGSDADTQSGGVITKYVYQAKNDPTDKITQAEYDALTEEGKKAYEAIDAQSLNFLYQLADGTYSLVKIDVSKFLTENEFGDGLQVSGAGVVSVKVDPDSESVNTAAGAEQGTYVTSPVLSVGPNGVKVDNIQTAIDFAVSQSTATLAVQAQGDEYVGASIDPNNNKKVIVATDVQPLTATAGTPGTYNSTTGAQTTAPTNGTLSGTANSLADSSDIATKVKTYVDGKVAIEAARSDAKNTADIYALDATVGSTSVASGKHVAVQVVEEHGVLTGVTVTEDDIASATALTNEIKARKAVDGQSGDTYTANSSATYIKNATSLNDADVKLDTQVKANADEIANGLNSISTSNAGVTVGTKSSKTQTVGLNLDTTTGNDGGLNGYSSSQNGGTGSNVLKITDNGLYLSDIWDCGTFD